MTLKLKLSSSNGQIIVTMVFRILSYLLITQFDLSLGSTALVVSFPIGSGEVQSVALPTEGLKSWGMHTLEEGLLWEKVS